MNKTTMNDQNKKRAKAQANANVVESLKDIGTSATTSLKEDLLKQAPKDILEQLFGSSAPKNFSGEITAGETVEIRDVFTGQQEEKQHLNKQIAFERTLHEEEKLLIERKSNELRIQLNILMEEVIQLSDVTADLGKETQIAAMQAPIEPGIYHVVFFEKLLGFIRSFRQKIEDASVWLHTSNARAAKKNAWGSNYKKHGAKYLLSGEHYISRSAG